jgi:hypothetical protein
VADHAQTPAQSRGMDERLTTYTKQHSTAQHTHKITLNPETIGAERNWPTEADRRNGKDKERHDGLGALTRCGYTNERHQGAGDTDTVR